MVVAVILFLLTLWWLYKHQLFGLFTTSALTRQRLMVLFLIKASAIGVFYFAYGRHGGLEKSDAGKFYHDAHVIASWGRHHPGDFVAFLSGSLDDSDGSAAHRACFTNTYNWNTGRSKDFFYNDNRIVIRLHAVIDFFTNGSFFTHALISLLIGWYGLFLLAQTFAQLLGGSLRTIFTIACLVPSVWFYTAAPLKEPLVLLVCGQLAMTALALSNGRLTYSVLIRFIFFAALALMLKPYVCGVWLLVCGAAVLAHRTAYRSPLKRAGVFTLIIVVVVGTANVFVKQMKGRSLAEQMQRQQKQFAITSAGGMYLSSANRYLRMAPDSSWLVKSPVAHHYFLKRGAAYAYWLDARPDDSLHVAFNTDTTTLYLLEDFSLPGRSNIATVNYGTQGVSQIVNSLYYGVVAPLPWQARGGLQPLMAFENLLLLAAILFLLKEAWRSEEHRWLVLLIIVMGLVLCALPGFTAPNSGAIFRYRMTGVLLIVCGAVSTFTASNPNNRYLRQL